MPVVLNAIPQFWIVLRQMPQHLLAQLVILHGLVEFFAGWTHVAHVVGQRQRHLIDAIELVDVGRQLIVSTFPVHLEEEEGAPVPRLVPIFRSGQYDVTIVGQSVQGGTELLPADAKHFEQLRCGLERSLRGHAQWHGALGVAQPGDVFGQYLLLALRAVAVPLAVVVKEERGDGADGIPDGGNDKAFAPLRQIVDVALVGQRLADGQVGYPTTIGIDEFLEGLGVVWMMGEFEGHVVPAAGGLELQMVHGIHAVVVLAIE